MTEKTEFFDVIIAGAGLAGLSAACELRLMNKKVLVLETESCAGGKVRTRKHEDTVYETGALFAFDPEWLPFHVDAGAYEPSGYPAGLFQEGKLVSGESVISCLAAINPGTRQMLCLRNFLESPAPQVEMTGGRLFAAADSFFRVIHPGDMREYIPARRMDCLVKHDTSRFRYGNGSMIKAMVKNAGADIRKGCKVTSVKDRNREKGLTVNWEISGGAKFHAGAERVIIATPAPEALEIIGSGTENASTRFLKKIRYGAGLVIVTCLKNTDIKPFSYIVSPSGTVNTFVFHHYPDEPGKVLVTAYIVGDRAASCHDMGEVTLTEKILEEIRNLGIGSVSRKNICFSDMLYWPAVGPIITEEAYSEFPSACLRPIRGVLLAGDYTWWDQQQMPYGMLAAIESGKRAAKMSFCAYEADTVTFHAKPLADTCVTKITEKGPEFLENMEDGDIAYYGWLLKEKPDPEIEKYLISETENGLWAYHHGYSPTSLDSALVIEGLIATGRHHDFLKFSAERLIEEFFDHKEGGFRTVSTGKKGRAAYWQGIDSPATAACGWTLQQIDSEKYSGIINTCIEYILKKQCITGCWPGKWFPSKTVPVFYAMRFLASVGQMESASCKRAALWLKSRQKHNGSWSDSVIESSSAILALASANFHKDCMTKGQNWLNSKKISGKWHGEPILEYFFDDNGQRTFFYTRDKGSITSAWANLALDVT